MRYPAQVTEDRDLPSRLLGLFFLSVEVGLPMLLVAALSMIAASFAGLDNAWVVASTLGGAVGGIGLAIVLSGPVGVVLDVLFDFEFDLDVFKAWEHTFGPERDATSIGLHAEGFILGERDRVSWEAVTAITETGTSVVFQIARPPMRQIAIDVRAPGAREAVREALDAAMRSGQLRL